MDTMIGVKTVTKIFGRNTVLDNISFDVPTGCVFALLGPNGAGKTSLIKIMLDLLRPNRGQVELFGRPSHRLSTKEWQSMAYVSEGQMLPAWMRVEYFIHFCRSFYPAWDDVFCQSLLHQFELPLDQKLGALSRGMKVKAQLIAALAYHPQLLILDEPFGGLDPLVREEFIGGVLENLHYPDKTIFMCSHDIEEVERLADWVAVLDRGHIKLVESVESLQRRFRKVHVQLPEGWKREHKTRKSWMLLEKLGTQIEFIDSQYERDLSERDYQEYFLGEVPAQVTEMSLREIYLAFAKTYKLDPCLYAQYASYGEKE